jgi:AcrR family transcriptional regulator
MKKERTKTKILDAARDEFGRKGYVAASTNAIAVAADVAKGSIFSHFGSKAGLFTSVFFRELDRMLADLDAFDRGEGKPVFERIVDVLAWKATYAATHPEATKVLLEGLSSPPDGTSDKILSRVQDLSKMSIRRFFGDLDWDRFRPEYGREDVYRILETAANGLQSTYIKAGMDIAYLESVRGESVAFMKTVLRGMEKTDGQGV